MATPWGFLAHTWTVVWFWPPEISWMGRGDLLSHSGLQPFWKVKKVFTAPTPVQIYLERLFPGGSEINGNLNFSPQLPKIQINFVFKYATTSLRLCENCSDHYLETETL